MTTELDALRYQLEKDQGMVRALLAERDAARRELAKAVELLRTMNALIDVARNQLATSGFSPLLPILDAMDSARVGVRAFLAAHPKEPA